TRQFLLYVFFFFFKQKTAYEITYGVQDVAQNANAAAQEVESANEGAEYGRLQVDKTIEQINRLSASVSTAVGHMQTLSSDADEIATVLDVIRAIAEQTNLLALKIGRASCRERHEIRV